MKPNYKVLYNVKIGPLKPWSNLYLNFIETLTWYFKKSRLGFEGLELIRVSIVNRV
jgi:hypothetical protein